MHTTTLTSKGQITLPKPIRERLHLKTGDRVSFVVDEEGRVVLAPAASDIRELRGLLRREGRKPKTVEEMNEAIGRHLAAKHARASSKGSKG